MELHLSYRARDLQGRCANPALGPLLREGLWSDGHCRHIPRPELPEKPADLGSQTATTFPRGPSSRNQPPYTRLPKPGKPPPRARASRLVSRSAHRARPRVCSHPMRCYPRTRIGRWVAGWPWLPKPARPPSPGKLPPATGPAPAPTSRSSRARSPHSRCSRPDVIAGRRDEVAGTRSQEDVSDAAALQFARSADAVYGELRAGGRGPGPTLCVAFLSLKLLEFCTGVKRGQRRCAAATGSRPRRGLGRR